AKCWAAMACYTDMRWDAPILVRLNNEFDNRVFASIFMRCRLYRYLE
ncbi:MAG: hypothetical protein ACI9TB_002431, partial [Parasphingorhabdus sp.]